MSAITYEDAGLDEHQKHVENALLAANIKMDDIGNSIEAYENENVRNVFQEATQQDRNKNFVQRILHSLNQINNLNLDMMHYMLGFIQLQTGRFDKLHNLTRAMGKNVIYTSRAKIDKNMRYGSHATIVRDGPTFLKQAAITANALKAAADLAEELSSVSAGASLVATKEILMGNNEEYAHELYERFGGEIRKAIRSMGLKPQNEEKSFRVFTTEDLLLGSVQPTATLPPVDYEKPTNLRDLRAALSRTGFYMYRRDKIKLGTMFEGSVELKFTGAELEELVKIGDNLLGSVVRLNGTAKRLSQGINNVANAVPRYLGGNFLGGRDLDQPEASMSKMFVAIRAANRLDMIVLDTLATTYHAGMGLSKKIASIVEKAR